MKLSKEEQRKTLQNIHTELNLLHVMGIDAERLLSIRRGIASLHDAIRSEIEEEAKIPNTILNGAASTHPPQ